MRKEKLEELNKYLNELKTIEITKNNSNTNKFLSVEAFNYKLNNGIILPRERIYKNGKDGSASIIMPITKAGEVLTVIEPRVFTKTGVSIGFPAGYIEESESPEVSALRELKEETGYTTEGRLILLDSYYQDEGCSSAYNYSFLALDCEKTTHQQLDQFEVIKYMLFTYEELFELEKMGYINGANSKITLEKSKVYMRGRY